MAAGEKPLRGLALAKQVKDPRRAGDCPNAYDSLDPGSEFLMFKELLESAIRGHDPVRKRATDDSARVPVQTRGNDEN